jgi:hypothetical protein
MWARLPLGPNDPADPPKPLRALIAGLLTGICCYGYPAVRLMLPALLGLSVLVGHRRWWALLRSPRGRSVVAAVTIGMAATLGPLAWRHVADPSINKRGETSWVWRPGSDLPDRLTAVANRYALHFTPDFLLVRGDLWEMQSPPAGGQLHLYEGGLLLAGAIALLRKKWRSPAGWFVIVFVLAYPLGDVLNSHMSAHAMRSLPGLPGLILMASVGAVALVEWMKNGRQIVAAFLAVMVVIGSNVHYLAHYYGEWNARELVYRCFHVDLMAAARWLKPRWDGTDVLLCTTQNMNQPYVELLVGLGYEPEQWFRDTRKTLPVEPWEIYTQVGRMHFLYWPNSAYEVNRDLHANGKKDHVVIFARPGEMRWLPAPEGVVTGPDGKESLWICQMDL